jgi:hypothetical protein
MVADESGVHAHPNVANTRSRATGTDGSDVPPEPFDATSAGNPAENWLETMELQRAEAGNGETKKVSSRKRTLLFAGNEFGRVPLNCWINWWT